MSTLCQVSLQNQSLCKHETYIHKYRTQIFEELVNKNLLAVQMCASVHAHASVYVQVYALLLGSTKKFMFCWYIQVYVLLVGQCPVQFLTVCPCPVEVWFLSSSSC